MNDGHSIDLERVVSCPIRGTGMAALAERADVITKSELLLRSTSRAVGALP
jgi:hypothetical protein